MAQATHADRGTGGPTTTKGEQTRRAVLDAAIARFGRDGYRSASVTDIARDAGVGGTVPYAYFANKEALFLAALDVDAAGIIDEALPEILDDPKDEGWRESLVFALVEAVGRHPLAERVLAGLEPHVTSRMLDIPALAELRATVAERLRADQAAGQVRPDIDPDVIARGVVTLFITILLGVVQFGQEGLADYAPDVAAVFGAALDPVDGAAGT